MPNVERFELSRVVAMPDGGEPPFYRIAEMWYGDLEELQAALAYEDGQSVLADMSNFVTGGATMLISPRYPALRQLAGAGPAMSPPDNSRVGTPATARRCRLVGAIGLRDLAP